MAFREKYIRIMITKNTEVGANNIRPLQKPAQQSTTIFSTSISAAQNAQLNILIFEAQRNFRNKLCVSVEAQRISAIAERDFRNKLKRNITSAIQISQHNANTAFFAIFDIKK